ncbi:methionyl-tRNA formyltransferase [Patescibacteria group bacterium]
MKIIFFGTPEYVLPILKLVHKKFIMGTVSPIVAVVTQTPKPAGRKQKPQYSAVDRWAHEHKIPIFYNFQQLPDADMGICAAFGLIIPKSTVDAFPLGILNIHPSLLPKYRGASPVQETIMEGVSQTGVTIIKMDEKVDHGPIVVQFKEEVNKDDTTGILQERLFSRAADVLVETIPAYVAGKIKPKEQNHKEATFTKRLTKEDGFISFSKEDPNKAELFIRAMNPWPMAWTYIRTDKLDSQSKRLKILKAHTEDRKLILDEVQLEGKNPVAWKQFSQAYPDFNF